MYYVAWLSSFVFHWCVLLPTCMQNLIRQARQIYGVIFAISNATPCCCFCSPCPAPNQPPISGGIYKNCQTNTGRNIAGNFVDYSHGKYRGWNGSTVEISSWADLARPSAGIKNSPKNLCSHVIFIVFFKF